MSQEDDNEKLESADLSEELAKLDVDSQGSSGNIGEDDSILGDTWIEELECALLADCDPATLKKISEGKQIPATLRPDYWRALLSLNDAEKVTLIREYDLENQLEIRKDCEGLVDDISMNLATEPLTDADKLRLKSDFESTLTTYVKARPEVNYIPGNGWTDILRVLYHLQLNDVLLYQIFFRIVDRYIPRDLSQKPTKSLPENSSIKSNSSTSIVDGFNSSANESKNELNIPKVDSKTSVSSKKDDSNNKSIQAYHLLRLLIQYHDPELCSILDSRKITPNSYVKEWFCSLFARSCTPKLALLIWDTHFKMADPFLIFFAAIVMVVNASDDLKKVDMDREEMLKVLKAMPSRLEENDIEDLYYLVANHYTNSTPRSIRSYSHLFFMDTFANTYSGNENIEDSPPLLDPKTSQLTNSLDLSQYLCLPIVPAEIFALDTAQKRSSPTQSASSLKYFLVDCRPAEQYNAGHLTRAFHLDCSLMLREPSSFATAVQALLEIQRQLVASKSNTGGQHLCFIGSGQEEEDQYVNMVVASFLQKYQKYVSIVVGGFDAIHDYVCTKNELKDSFNKYIIDHNQNLCKACNFKSKNATDKMSAKNPDLSTSTSLNSAQSLFASTTSFLRGDKTSSSSGTFAKIASNPQASANLIAQSSASMFDKFATAFVSKSSVIKDKLVETLNTTAIPSASSSTGRDHVSSHDKLGKRYTGSNLRYAIDDNDDDLSGRLFRGNRVDAINEPIQEIQIDSWQQQTKILAFYKCSQIKGAAKYPGFLALSKTHLWILREIPHNKGFASIAAKRSLDTIVQITSKRRQPDLIIFRYGLTNQHKKDDQENPDAKSLPFIIATDQLHIPDAFEVIRLIKREIVRIMDENSKAKIEASKKAMIEDSQTKEKVTSDTNQNLAVSDSVQVTPKVDETEDKND